MEAVTLAELPFFNVTDAELEIITCTNAWSTISDNSELLNYIHNLHNSEIFKQLKFNYVTEDQFNSRLGSNKNVELSLFHVNIRSLNSKHLQLCQFIELIILDFDVIVLSEVWSTNINFYSNILPGYTFYYDLPVDSTVGGVGIFVKADLVQHEVPQYKLPNSSTNRVENIWLEIVKDKHYIIGGIYRHPNQNISIFRDSFDPVLNRLSSQKYPCLIAGDINIDLTKCNVNNQTAEYVDMLLLNNFVPTVVMPTRITSHSATLIDHMYYYEGKKPVNLWSLKVVIFSMICLIICLSIGLLYC